MNYQLVSTSDVPGNVDVDCEELTVRVNALIAKGYEPIGGPVVRNNPEVGDYFVQAMLKPNPPMVVIDNAPIENKLAAKKTPAKKAQHKKPAAKRPVVAKKPSGK